MLRIAAARRYAALPIPADEDTLVEEFLDEWRAGGAQTKEAPEALDRAGAFLGVFIIRAASRAVRNQDVQLIRLGLQALSMVGADEDPRDLATYACVLVDSYSRLGVEPAFLLKEASSASRGGAATILKTFLDLPKAQRTLQKYRIRESSDEDGFRYAIGVDRQPLGRSI
jgi:hypothetical protein